MFPNYVLLWCSVLFYKSISFIFVCNRLGVIEEEKEEDERKLSVAIAAAERINVLVRQTERQLSSFFKE